MTSKTGIQAFHKETAEILTEINEILAVAVTDFEQHIDTYSEWFGLVFLHIYVTIHRTKLNGVWHLLIYIQTILDFEFNLVI